MSHMRRSLGLALFALWPSLAFAAPVTYNESIDGDLSGSSWSKLFIFGIGQHTISGNTGRNTLAVPSVRDFDGFRFIVPLPGYQVTAGSVTLVDTEGDLITAPWDLRLDSPAGPLVETFAPSVPGTHTLVNVPLGVGHYHVSPHEQLGDLGWADYTFTFTVIPEPAGLSLLALGSLALLRRRR